MADRPGGVVSVNINIDIGGATAAATWRQQQQWSINADNGERHRRGSGSSGKTGFAYRFVNVFFRKLFFQIFLRAVVPPTLAGVVRSATERLVGQPSVLISGEILSVGREGGGRRDSLKFKGAAHAKGCRMNMSARMQTASWMRAGEEISISFGPHYLASKSPSPEPFPRINEYKTEHATTRRPWRESCWGGGNQVCPSAAARQTQSSVAVAKEYGGLKVSHMRMIYLQPIWIVSRQAVSFHEQGSETAGRSGKFVVSSAPGEPPEFHCSRV